MNQKNNGGPAFPEQIAVTLTGDTYSGNPGMTLRDYFAAHVIQGMLADPGVDGGSSLLAAKAFQMADAMLAERAK